MQNKPCPQTSRHRLALDLLADTTDTHIYVFCHMSNVEEHIACWSAVPGLRWNSRVRRTAGREPLCKIKRNGDIKMHVEALRAMCH